MGICLNYTYFFVKKEDFMEDQNAFKTETMQVSPFAERVTEVFTSPDKLYTEVSISPVQNSSWIFPYIISLVLSVLFTIALFSNQSLRDQIMEPQLNQLHHRVEKGELTQEQADRAEEFMASSSIMLITSTIGTIVIVSISVFTVPLVFWLIVRFIFKSQTGYKKILEIYGLSAIIGILNTIVTLIMMHLFDSVYATPGLSLLIMSNFDYTNTLHKIIGSLNFITNWQTVIFGIGIAKASNKTNAVGVFLSLSLWLIYIIISSLTGIGIR